jgi:hypothetical protein
MNYSEMVDALVNMSEHERQDAIMTHWQAVLSDGFIAFVQGQMEAARSMASGTGGFSGLLGMLHGDAARQLQHQALHQAHALSVVWDSMDAVYRKLQADSERQGNDRGMVGHGHHRTMPAGRSVDVAAGCYRCGASAVSLGLCSGCLATQQDWEQDALRHDEQRWDNLQEDLRHQQLRDDQIYRDHQQDFNSYQSPDYGSYSNYSSDY